MLGKFDVNECASSVFVRCAKQYKLHHLSGFLCRVTHLSPEISATSLAVVEEDSQKSVGSESKLRRQLRQSDFNEEEPILDPSFPQIPIDDKGSEWGQTEEEPDTADEESEDDYYHYRFPSFYKEEDHLITYFRDSRLPRAVQEDGVLRRGAGS